MKIDYTHITELSGDAVSAEQIHRMCNRYGWAGQYCNNKDVLELACGTGQGAGYLSGCANYYLATDYSWPMVKALKSHYRDRVDVLQCSSELMPVKDESFDVIIVFEAIYYFPDIKKFVSECMRVLRKNGKVLIATANKDLYDFNPSPHSIAYYGVLELKELFSSKGLTCQFYGDVSVRDVSVLQKLARPIKWLAVKLNFVPKTNDTKKWLKSLVFGKLVTMPSELTRNEIQETYTMLKKISSDSADMEYKVILCEASK